MIRSSLILAALLCGCATTTAVDDTADLDGAVDRKVGTDGTVNDTGRGNDSASSDSGDDSSVDDASDDGGIIIIDAGGSDGGMCPPCIMPNVCCMVVKSQNYLKCYNKACLACCM